MVIDVAREAAISTLLLIASPCDWSDARAAQSRQISDTYAQEKERKVKGAKAKPVQARSTRTRLASYHGPGLQGRKTASGETFDKTGMVAAHPSYALGTASKSPTWVTDGIRSCASSTAGLHRRTDTRA